MNKSVDDSFPSYTKMSVSHYFLFIFLTLYLIVSLLLIMFLCSSCTPIFISDSMLFLHLVCHVPHSRSFQSLSQESIALSLRTPKQEIITLSPIFLTNLDPPFHSTSYYLLDIKIICAHNICHLHSVKVRVLQCRQQNPLQLAYTEWHLLQVITYRIIYVIYTYILVYRITINI